MKDFIKTLAIIAATIASAVCWFVGTAAMSIVIAGQDGVVRVVIFDYDLPTWLLAASMIFYYLVSSAFLALIVSAWGLVLSGREIGVNLSVKKKD